MNDLDKIPGDTFDETAKSGQKNILHYFDRIHDKLFTLNNILIAGYFTAAKLNPQIGMSNIIFPFINLVFLIFVEYRMMELSRVEANILNISLNQLETKLFRKYSKVTLLSFFAILSTLTVTIIFLTLILR
jgi:hypothetical protein